MFFVQRAPRAPLESFVECIWLCRNEPQPHALERVLPTGRAQLIINLKEDETRLYDPRCPGRCLRTAGTVLSGIHSRYQIIDVSEQEYAAGAAFKPGGIVPFTRLPAHETADMDIPMEELWGRQRTADLRDRILESASVDRALDAVEAALLEMWTPRRVHPAVAFALAAFDRAPQTASIGAVTGAIGMSAKRFIEQFKAHVGATPKRYCRIRRFQRAVRRAHSGRDVDWAQVALDCGYFDQPHFIHDFRAFAGITPSSYQAARTQFQNHVRFLQSGDEDL